MEESPLTLHFGDCSASLLISTAYHKVLYPGKGSRSFRFYQENVLGVRKDATREAVLQPILYNHVIANNGAFVSQELNTLEL